MVRWVAALCVTLVLVAATVPAASTGGCERQQAGREADCCGESCCGGESGDEGAPPCSDQACCFHAAICLAPALVTPATSVAEAPASQAPLPIAPTAPPGDILHVPRAAA